MELAEIIKTRRTELGLSQTAVAKAVGINTRQIARYENGEQQPALPVAVKLAETLQITLPELAGQTPYQTDLTGTWKTKKNDSDGDVVCEVTVTQTGNKLHITNKTTGCVGQAQIFDNDTIIGWYQKTGQPKTSIHYQLNPNNNTGHGTHTTTGGGSQNVTVERVVSD